MKNIKNGRGKLVCRADESEKVVEIIHKGAKTEIKFKPDGTMEVINSFAA